MSKEKQGEESDQLKVELGKLSTSIPVTQSEVETQEQQPDMENREKVVIEEYPKEDNPLADYNLAMDREIRQSRAPIRFGYESELSFAHASSEKLADKELKTFEDEMKS